MCSSAPVHNMKYTESIVLALSILQNISRPSPQGTQGIILGWFLFSSLPFEIIRNITFCFFSRTEGNIFTRRYKMPKEPNYRQIEKKILDDVLSPDVYDPRIRPAGLNTTGKIFPQQSEIFLQCYQIFSDGPSLVFVNVFVRSFSSIDDVKMVRFIFSKAFYLGINRWNGRNRRLIYFYLNS